MSQSVDKLKELLFEPENRAMRDFEQRLDSVFDRAGSDERLEDSVSRVIDGALRSAEVANHDQLSDAVAPLVIKTIKTEIFASKDTLVEALYPMTGRMVKAYVTSAVNDLADQVNQRLAANPFMIGMQVLSTGQSPAKIALANSKQLQVEEVYLIRRGSGELLARWPESIGTENKDQMMSGVLTAINEFANEAFAENDANLRQISVGGQQLFMRASPSYLLAAKCNGVAPKAVEKILDEAFLDAIEKHDAMLTSVATGRLPVANNQAITTLATDLETRVNEQQTDLRSRIGRGPSPFKIVLWLIGLPLLAWIAWSAYVSFETNRVRSIATNILNTSEEIRGYPTRLDVSRLGKTVTIAGLTPGEEAQTTVLGRLKTALPNSEIVGKFGILTSGGPDLSPELRLVRRDFAALQSRLTQDDITRATNWASGRLADSTATLSSLAEVNQVDPNTKKTIESVQKNLAVATGDLRSLQDQLSQPVATDVELEASKPQLQKVHEKILAATADLQGLLGGSEKQTDAQGSKSFATLEPNVAAQELAIKAERLATVAVAVDQVLRLPKPKPVIAAQPATPREQLVRWTQDNAVFFSSDTDYRSPLQTDSDLDALAALVGKTTSVLRIVGYTDDRGRQNKNITLSQARADKVRRALISRGVSPTRLIAVGRKNARDLSRSTGDGSPNRRVEFEVGFANEKAQ